jgi:hypothetical protein
MGKLGRAEDYADLLGTKLTFIDDSRVDKSIDVACKAFVAGIDPKRGITIAPLSLDAMAKKFAKAWGLPLKETRERFGRPGKAWIYCLVPPAIYGSKKKRDYTWTTLSYEEMFLNIVRLLRENKTKNKTVKFSDAVPHYKSGIYGTATCSYS